MDPARFIRVDTTAWRLDPQGAMRVPVVIFADEDLIRDMDDKVCEQAVNVAMLPGRRRRRICAARLERCSAGGAGFALLCDDPEAPSGTWRDWAIYDIPADRTELAETPTAGL